MKYLLGTLAVLSSVAFVAPAAWSQEQSSPCTQVDVVGNAAMDATEIFAFINDTRRTISGDRVRIGRVSSFTAETSALFGTIQTDHTFVGGWLQELASRGAGPADVLDPSDLGSVLLWEEAARDDELALLFHGREGQSQLLEIIDARRDAINDERRAIRDAAAEEVEGWSEKDWADSYWRPGEEEQAAGSLYRERFDRTRRRQRRALGIQEDILKELIELEDPIAIDERMRAYIEVHDAAALNDKLGVTRQVGSAFGHRINRLKDSVIGPGSGGTMQSPALVPSDEKDVGQWQPVTSTFWQARTAEQTTPAQLYFGPWFTDADRPVVPVAGETLKLDGFRDKAADGMHPSVSTTDEAGVDWKVKLYNHQYIAAETISSRLWWALGYNTEPTYNVPRLQLEPRALAAAYRYKNKIPSRNFGYSPYKPQKALAELMTPDGLLVGEDAIELFKDSMKDPETLATFEHARIDYAEVVYKDGDAESVGPWGYTHFNHEDLREVRSVGMVISWLMGSDYKFNNVRLDALEVDDDVWQIQHVMSDVGSGIRPNGPDKVPWEVGIDPDGPLFHNNKNNFSTKAFDDMTREDAQWALRQIGSLSEDQITASFAAGSTSWPVTRLYIEKFIARRDDLVQKFELTKELGLLRPAGPNTALTVRGDGVLELDDGVTITIPAGNYEVIDGEVHLLD